MSDCTHSIQTHGSPGRLYGLSLPQDVLVHSDVFFQALRRSCYMTHDRKRGENTGSAWSVRPLQSTKSSSTPTDSCGSFPAWPYVNSRTTILWQDRSRRALASSSSDTDSDRTQTVTWTHQPRPRRGRRKGPTKQPLTAEDQERVHLLSTVIKRAKEGSLRTDNQVLVGPNGRIRAKMLGPSLLASSPWPTPSQSGTK